MDLTKKKCVPCEGGTLPLKEEGIKTYLSQLKDPWEVIEGKKIKKQFIFKNFPAAIEFVNKVAAVAEQEQHHPDLHIFYSRVIIELWTHAIGGLSENDFIMAAKIENL